METLARFGPQIDALEAFTRDRAVLLDLVRGLDADEWDRPTAAAPWRVRDVVAHMIGDDLNRLSRTRDGHSGPGPRAGEALTSFVHRINDEWVQVTQRTSPRVLTDLLALTSPQVLAMWGGLDPGVLTKAVSWAGPDPAPVWLDLARDFTEYWVHQQQIRDAIGRPDPGDPAVVHTVLDTFLRAVPHTLSAHPRPDGETLDITVDGAAGGRWTWRCDGQRWRWAQNPGTPGTLLAFPGPEPLWRLCVRMVEPAEARRSVTVSGDEALAAAAMQIVSIIR
ncbi:maleylpyruvate isomerase family mycothiol-dependent enzyme [Pseudonocardia sp. MH-G8]|uniref:maleylpyruvate isomerase family mycothiol-dependent enzyme n=1 Tax=Pseudonocardia sp. MH-G8 TaxID=1854588 RepID=UPI00130408DE|nr:maleylpyruvate isomerase family mycothiol-dependent enzyme [Pseudonocardia sp. MH-G8]